ncbi:MAG: VOC family protein [Tannerellaceae bacterium]|nr:VOC family protein [Tannerellaceae bacterium]
MLKLEPYINFDGSCEDAFEFYKSVFGGEFKGLFRYEDLPNSEIQTPIPAMEKIVHIGLPIGETVVLMGTDKPDHPSAKEPGNIELAISTSDEAEVVRIFNALSEGGKVTMPLQKTFWAELYGTFTDKFDIHWIISKAKQEDA